MGLLRKIGAALRGRQHDSMQEIVDSQAIRILEQEIRDCQHSVAQAKAELTKVVAEHKASERELDQLQAQAVNIEKRAITALSNNDETLATHLSGQIADIESAVKEQRTHCEEMLEIKAELRKNLLSADRQIKQHLRDIRLARACDSAQKGVTTSHSHGLKLGAQLQEVKSSLSRIKERRLQTTDMSKAEESVEVMLGNKTPDNLDQRSGEILARLRQQQMASSTA